MKSILFNKIDDMHTCQSEWQFIDSDSAVLFKVLNFNRKEYVHSSLFSNFIIAVSQNLDTVGLMDFKSDVELVPGNVIIFGPDYWNKDDKLYIHPLTTIYPDEKINALHCKVKKVYYGKIFKKYF